MGRIVAGLLPLAVLDSLMGCRYGGTCGHVTELSTSTSAMRSSVAGRPWMANV